MKIQSRYSELIDVSLNPEDFPNDIRHLFQWICDWCLSDPNEVEALVKSKSSEDIQQFIDAFQKCQESLDSYIQEGLLELPVPDSVVAADLAYQSYDLLLSMR